MVDAASWLSQYQGFTDAGSDVLSKYHHPSETDSFRINNKEIRDEVLEFFEKGNIWYFISDDNLITIFLSDGDKVDKIYTDVRLTYIRRN